MNVTVLGAGAMGSLFGGLLARSGNQVTLLDIWQEHVDAIDRDGLLIEEDTTIRIKNIKAASPPAAIDKTDLLIVFVKSTVTGEALEQVKGALGPDTIVLTLQNGLGNVEKISACVGQENVIAGTTAHGSTLLGPGKVRHAGRGLTVIGEINGQVSSRVLQIASMLNEATIQTKVTDNVLGLIWDKLLVNVGINALTAITGLENGKLLHFRETEELLEMAVSEGIRVARAKGIMLGYDDPIAHTKEICSLTGKNKSSMLQDILNKRKTEIDTINGAIVREGEQLGIETPVNKVLTNLIKTVQEKCAGSH